VVLLRFLETGEIQRIGADRAHTRVNVRLITATNRDLQAQIVAGAFREDLYFRLNVIRLTIPPLRERTDDIPILVQHFLEMYSRVHRTNIPEVTPAAMDTLMAYRWPGNIRELRNVAERIILKTGGEVVRPGDLPSDIVRPAGQSAAQTGAQGPARTPIAEELANLVLKRGESFWSAVYPMFIARDLTRADLRRIVEIGLENTNGNYRLLVQLFNMPVEDYKRFLSFLRKHDCHIPFQRFRTPPARVQPDAVSRVASGASHG
jgi:DNA-binding NtrC family response regulator